VLGVKAKPVKAGRFASLDPCARFRPRTAMIAAPEPGLAAARLSHDHDDREVPFRL
jgi:hypothetical protein